jgi:hypothetical protein
MSWNFLVQVFLILLSALTAAWFTRRHYLHQRRLAFREQQLREFYSAILGLRKIIQAKTEIRVKVWTASDETWKQLCQEARRSYAPIETQERLSRERFPSFQKGIDFDQDQLRNEVLPMFRQMVVLFKEKYWLADPDTQQFLPALTEFVELWDRNIAGAMPWEVIEHLKPTEKGVEPFYQHIELKHEALRKELSGEDAK